ncbi:class I adenylate-forming enzyme family protein [Novosphingobium bradum]|uniref:Class I adenylate-forming enzyme family protein n=1 Tax=Novosphingobium bradum TaxID=1737444 RepID=A0ABV7IR08_9SPHN
MNIALILEMAADAAPDRVGLVCDGVSWTYGELLHAARGAAQVIRASGAHYVALLDESSEAAPIALFGAGLAGVPYCPLNYRLADADLAALLGRIAPALVIGDVTRVENVAGGQGHTPMSRAQFVEAARTATVPEDAEYDGGEGIAIQLFTSGTTAAPKAAILRHSNLLGYILGTVEFASAEEDDAAVVVVPPYHIAGISALLSSIYSQRKIALLPAFTPEGWLKLVESEKATNAFVVPTMLTRIIDTMGKGFPADVSTLKAIAYGGGKMPLEVISKALVLFPETGFTNAYGLTETSSTVALLGPEDHREAFASDDPKARARLTSLGKPIPSVEMEIRDEDGRVLGPNEAGEIYVRGDQVSGEYKEKSALDAEGWFPTRDAGYMDEDGYLFLSGRADDVIVRGGENMSPGEIEDVLLTHPAVADAAAVGIPSVEWGEAVAVALVCKDGQPGEDELKALVKERLRSSRVPERIVFVPELPYNEMGKLLRREVKKLF